MDEYQMPRAQHLQWAKNRALQYVDAGQLQYAFDSLMSDARKTSRNSIRSGFN